VLLAKVACDVPLTKTATHSRYILNILTMTPHPSVQIYPECTVSVRKYDNGTVLPEYSFFSMSMRQ